LHTEYACEEMGTLLNRARYLSDQKTFAMTGSAGRKVRFSSFRDSDALKEVAV